MRNCYGASLAYTFSRHARGFIQEPKYKALFPHVELSKEQTAVEDWALTTSKTTAYFCAGVGGPITGKGCTLVKILDDPIKNFEDACSEVILDKTWDWKRSTHDSRAEKGCPEIIIATRWSRRDPSGRSLDEEKGEWDEVKVPALDSKDRSFCEEIQTTEHYRIERKRLDKVIWMAEYQQEPIEAEGLLYPEEELNRFSLKETIRFENDPRNSWDGVIGYTDTADEGVDYLCSLIGKIKGDEIFVEDVVYTQEPIEVTEGLIAAQLITYRPDRHIIESNNGGKSFAKNVRELIRGQSNAKVMWKPNTQNKMTRMIMKSGKVKEDFWFRDDYEDGSDYDVFMRHLTSLVRMGKNKYDDSGDAVTGLAETLDKSGLQFA